MLGLKELSINIQMFQKVDIVNKNFNGGFSQIKILGDNESPELNPVIFFNNPANKNYFFVIVLIYDDLSGDLNKKIMPLGEFPIDSSENQIKRVGKENIQQIGIFDGTVGQIYFNIKNVKLEVGKYEMTIIGKEVKNDEEKLKIRESCRKGEIDDLVIYASFPFNVIK